MFSQGVVVVVVVRAGPVSAAILSSAGLTPIITSNQAGLVTGLPLYITLSRGHEGCHAARVTAAGGNRQHTTTSEFGSFGYNSDHFHLGVECGGQCNVLPCVCDPELFL